MIFYFTGTGNSLWTAKELGKSLNQPIESITKHRQENRVVCNDAVVGFVFPTYMGDLPWIVKAFLLKLTVRPDCYAFVVMTSNNGKSGSSFKSLDQSLSCSGAALSAGFDLQMPGNCLISPAAENDARLKNAPERLSLVMQAIKAGEINFTSDRSKPKEDFVTASYFYGEHSLKRLTLMKNFSVSKDCNGCGVCASVCPLTNIKIADGKAVHGHHCAACYACLHWCPQHATLLRVPTLKHRPQYHHPEITLKEIRESQT